MTVREFIEQLSALDPDMELIESTDRGYYPPRVQVMAGVRRPDGEIRPHYGYDTVADLEQQRDWLLDDDEESILIAVI